MDTTKHLVGLSDNERLYFQTEFNANRKSTGVAYLLVLFTGGIGGQHYYMRNLVVGLIYTAFCWTLIPAVLSFFELFTTASRVKHYNERLADSIVARVKLLRQETPVARAA